MIFLLTKTIKSCRFMLMILIMGMLQGCVPLVAKFNYISLADIPDIKVVQYGKYELGRTFSHDAMPIEYKLLRESYDLYFELDMYGTGGVLVIWARNNEGAPLSIFPRKVQGSCGGVRSFSTRNEKWKSVDARRYSWGTQTKNCIHENKDYRLNVEKRHRVIAFEVRDESGFTILATEELPFEWVSNGYYVYYDAI